jgi:hypothetical protein
VKCPDLEMMVLEQPVDLVKVCSRVLQAWYSRTVLCKGFQCLSTVLVKHPGVQCPLQFYSAS